MNKGFLTRLVIVITLVVVLSSRGAGTYAKTTQGDDLLISTEYTILDNLDSTYSPYTVIGEITNDFALDVSFPVSEGERDLIQNQGVASVYASHPPTGTLPFGTGEYPSPRVSRRDTQEESRKEEEECKTCENALGVGTMSLAPMAVGAPDDFGYTFKDSSELDGPAFSFIDISATGTSVALGDDDGDGPFPVGFDFPFYGETKTEFFISSNGYIAFNSYDLSNWDNHCPVVNSYGPDDIVAIYWDDLNPFYYGDLVYYETLAPCPYGGTGTCLVVQYEDYHHYRGGIAGTFEAILFGRGDILIQFEDAGDEMGYGSTTGIENSTHTDGLTYACNSAGSISTGLAVLFSYPSALRLSKTVDDTLPSPGQRITYTLNVESLNINVTNTVVSDTLPADLTFAGPVVLEPPQSGVSLAQDAGDLPIVASGLTITDGNRITLTFPVTVNASASGGIINTAAVTGTEVITPQVDDVAVNVVGDCDVPGNPISNCSFETGDFTGWVTADLSSPLFPVQIGGAGIDLEYGAFSSAPTHGDYAALHGFDGDGPGTIWIAQDVTLPSGILSLEFLYRAAWDLVNYGAMQNRRFLVRVEPSGGNPYPFQTTTVLTATAGTEVTDTSKVRGAVDLSAFAGKSVRIVFSWDVPENYSGPGFFQLDNVFVRIHEPPTFTSMPVTDATEDVIYTYNIAAVDADPWEVLAFAAPTLPGWLTLTDHGDGTAVLSGVPTNSDVGDHAVMLQAEDSFGLTDTQSFSVTVSNVNDVPVFTSTPVTSLLKDKVYTYTITVSDVDAGDKLFITAPTLPVWLTLTDHRDGTAILSGTPSDTEVGEHGVALEVTDGTVVVSQPFTITVYSSMVYFPVAFQNHAPQPDTISILAWITYADIYWEYDHTLAAMEQYFSDFTLAESTTLDPAILAVELDSKKVLLIPEQEYSDYSNLFSIGLSWSSTLNQFLQEGGVIVVLDYGGWNGGSYGLLEGAGLMDVVVEGDSYWTGSYALQVVQSSHPLVQGIPSSFQGADGTLHFSSSDGTEVVEETVNGHSVVLAKDVGTGHIALIGFDFFEYNDDMARLLANAVQW